MPRFFPLAAVACLAALPAPLLAQEGEGPPPPTGHYVDHQPVDLNGPVFVPTQGGGATTPAVPPVGSGVDIGPSVSRALLDAAGFCAALPDNAYQVDCLAERLAAIAASMPSTGPYAESKAALESASAQLRSLVVQNADAGKPRRRYSTPTAARPQSSSRPLTAVSAAALPAVQTAAVAIIAQTETVLLRSSETQVAQAAEIRQIAAAVGSNKVLLRSA